MITFGITKAYNTLKTLRTNQPMAPIIADACGKFLTESDAVLNKQTELCRDLYKYPLKQVSFRTIPNQKRTTKVRPY
ncbi:hypothetical protein DPMN_051007 [Dreissena polymorpha]|uniref:Uncharacterized protein n=1 Tax=Dreissena polymorpha TaxID=45954 RepID=A0A9D4HLS8_DREPO|nr:hypothetical protein DPMN_051007 [Dreissena polymorpha]